jgi:hypothetical protein
MNRKRAPEAIVHQPAAQFYDRFVEGIKKRIRTAQIKAALAANAQLVLHYWEIGFSPSPHLSTTCHAEARRRINNRRFVSSFFLHTS